MILYAITSRQSLRRPLENYVAALWRAGVDWVQLREKDLPARELLRLASRLAALPRPENAQLLVNTRMDVALASGAEGVHLPSQAPPANELRRIAPGGFLIGVSCHSVEEVRRAQEEGADFVVFGPVFDTPSKRAYGPPAGLERLAQACRAVAIPVLALGGVTPSNAADCLAAGAAGIAAISLFQDASDLPAMVQQLRALPALR